VHQKCKIEDKEGTLLQILSKFSATYCRSRNFKSFEIQKTSEESFRCVSDGIGSLTELSKSHIQAATIQAQLDRKNPFVTAFDVLVKEQIGLLKEPSLNRMRLVVKELQENAGSNRVKVKKIEF
jgi:hypothetical protein